MKKQYFLSMLLTTIASVSLAQIDINTVGTAITQDFNTLADGSWTNGTTLSGWYSYETNPYGGFSTITADDGGSNSGKLYSYGSAGNSDRALGSVGSGGTGSIGHAVHFKNNTGQTLMSFDITYTAEQWRDAGTSAHTNTFHYKIGTGLTPLTETEIKSQTGLTAHADLDMTTPQMSQVGAIDGNASANKVTITETLYVTLNDQEEIVFAWIDQNDGGSDHGMGIDDFSVTPSTTGSSNPPEVAFSSTSGTVSEDGTTYSVELFIQQPNSVATMVDVNMIGGTAVNNTDFVATLPSTITFPAMSNVSQTFDITIKDNDKTNDGDKTIELELSNATNMATIGTNARFTLTIKNDDFDYSEIKDVIVTDGNNEPTVKGTVKIKGLVYGINNRGSGLQFTVNDSVAGINVITFTQDFDYTVTEGDEVTVQGPVSFYNGTIQLGTVLDTVIKHSSGNTLKPVRSVTMLDESTEADLVRLKGVWILDDAETAWPDNGNIDVTNGQDTFIVRIDGEVDLAGMDLPTYDTMSIVGIGGQFDGSSPYDDGYQIFPRYASDISQYSKTTENTENQTIFGSIYPNPAADFITIELTQDADEYEVISQDGKVVLFGSITHRKALISLSELSSGIYIIKVKGDKTQSTKKFLLN